MEPRNYVHVLIVHTQYCCDYERVTQIVQKITKTSCNIPAAVRCCIKIGKLGKILVEFPKIKKTNNVCVK